MNIPPTNVTSRAVGNLPMTAGTQSLQQPVVEEEGSQLAELGAKLIPGAPPVYLQNFGGKVLDRPTFYSVYLGKFWKSDAGEKLSARLDGFAKMLFGSKQMDLWKEYDAGKGRFIGSSAIDERAAARIIRDETVQAKLQRDIAAKKLPAADGETVYTVYLPPGTVVEIDGRTSQEGIGGYHSSFDTPDGKRVYYAVIVYSENGNGANITGRPEDNFTVASSHEWTEAVTDPDVNNGALGWYDRNYGEVGDIPVELARTRQDVYGSIAGYAVQKEWSNRDRQPELFPRKQAGDAM